jgi:subtilisin family serine protease
MKLLYLVFFAINLTANDAVLGEFFLKLESVSRTTFDIKVMKIQSELGVNTRSSVGIGQFLDSYEFINTVAVSLNPEAYKSMLENPDVEEIIPITKKYAFAVQSGATWGLSRISSKSKARSKPYAYKYDPKASGDGIPVFVIDTGIYTEHEDFQGRASWGKVVIEGDSEVDENGHGTHCAGTIAGNKYGVAKKAKVIAVKVLDSEGNGSDKTVVDGIEYVHDYVKTNKIKAFVANISLGGKASKVIDDATEKLYQAGGIVVVAAGNEDEDACDVSPARGKNMVTVGCFSEDNKKSWFSNWGKCINILAPGGNITSTFIGSKTATKTLSGTSMAAPHVAGLAAALWSGSKTSSNKDIISKIFNLALKDQSTGWKNESRADTVNRMAYNGQDK